MAICCIINELQACSINSGCVCECVHVCRSVRVVPQAAQAVTEENAVGHELKSQTSQLPFFLIINIFTYKVKNLSANILLVVFSIQSLVFV